MFRRVILVLFSIVLGSAGGSIAIGQEEEGTSSTVALHDQIDQYIEDALEEAPAALATDGEFVRRVYLDFTGMIPTSNQARAFLDDPSPYKRERLVDELLESPEFARQFARFFDLTFMERRRNRYVDRDDWEAFLLNAVATNQPYDELCREILSASGDGEGVDRAPSRFLLDREVEANLVTRDLGRIFLGRDLQCAQCHDHPLVEDYKQAHYYGIAAFVDRTSLFTDPKSKVARLAEKADGVTKFASVFIENDEHTTVPKILEQPSVKDPEATGDAGMAYLLPPAKSKRSIPRYSRRDQLAMALTTDVEAFDANVVNRIWAYLMKSGLVEPVDMMHAENPPSHPEVLDLLAASFREHDYNIRWLLRELAATRVYQRSSEPPPTGSEGLSDPWQFAVYQLRPMSAEQLCWSVMQGLGIVASTRQQVIQQIEQVDTKLGDILEADPIRADRKPWIIEEALFKRLRGNEGQFVRYFGSGEGQSPDALHSTVHQALFLSNGQPIQSWIRPSGKNLTATLVAIEDQDQLIEELYLALFSRRPSSQERLDLKAYLNDQPDGTGRQEAIQEMIWALLTSTEFRFHH